MRLKGRQQQNSYNLSAAKEAASMAFGWCWDYRASTASNSAMEYEHLRNSSPVLTAKAYLKYIIANY